ncbi:MAG: hypothetical protein FWE57_12280 [Chitinispirillia bacterium]|nr:hypothetical protein [Chitinispirillia bacterium]
MMTPDSAQIVFDELRFTLGMLYQAMNTMEPVIRQQIKVIDTQRFVGNLMLFISFLVTIAVVVLVHLNHQQIKIKQFWQVQIKNRWIAAVISVFALSVMLFNFFTRLFAFCFG